MESGPGRYEIRIRGKLDTDWSEWFDGMEVLPGPEGETILSGVVPDQAALHGLLARVRDLNLTLVAVRRIGERPQEAPQ